MADCATAGPYEGNSWGSVTMQANRCTVRTVPVSAAT